MLVRELTRQLCLGVGPRAHPPHLMPCCSPFSLSHGGKEPGQSPYLVSLLSAGARTRRRLQGRLGLGCVAMSEDQAAQRWKKMSDVG